MSKRFKQVNVQQFAILVQEIDISKYTQEEYVDVVEAIMKEELSKAIGNAPKLAREEWCKSNMQKHLESLKEKTKVVA